MIRKNGFLAATSIVVLTLMATSCTMPDSAPLPVGDVATPLPVSLPEQCRNDGAVQTWLLLPQDRAESELMAAYRGGEVIEFQGRVVGQNDDPARLPHRAFVIGETAEGVTMLLDYQGDPPPLALDQTYRMVAWADLIPEPNIPVTTSQTSPPRPSIPKSRGYELQVYDSAGLLFLGLTDVDLQDDPLDIELTNAAGDCTQVRILNNDCVVSRQVMPLRIRWGDDELTLYPGQDGKLAHQGSLYEVSVYRNRGVQATTPACPDYFEHRRSVRIERLQPPPTAPLPPTVTITTTAPLTASVPMTTP